MEGQKEWRQKKKEQEKKKGHNELQHEDKEMAQRSKGEGVE